MILDRPKALGQLLAQGTRRTSRILRPQAILSKFTQSTPAELVLVPKDLRTPEPELARDFYDGKYFFAGTTVNTKGKSPFKISHADENISEEWQRELHSFRWLRHLSATKTAIANSHAQAMIADWIEEFGTPGNKIAWQEDIAAQRLISWLCHSVTIVESADIKLYKRFLKSIGTHIQFLNNALLNTVEGIPRLQARIALVYAALCVKLLHSKNNSSKSKTHEALGQTLSRQIFADGGHISRCPSVLPEILLDLLPLRQSYEYLAIAPPQELINAIDRMMPAIRYYRHRDGNFARFNGVGPTSQNVVATILRYDDAMGEPTKEASQSGYQRMDGGPTTLIMDVGKPPKGEYSINANAGCLSFEMSSLRTCIVTNCGMPQLSSDDLVSAARSTAAHSTAVIHNTSSCRFHQGGMFKRYLGARILAGPGRVTSERKLLEGFTQIVARHDGYLRKFGVWHERILQLSNDGNFLFGRDQFFVNGGKAPTHMTKDDCAIRFHLHPTVKASIDADSGAIIVEVNENQFWTFTSDNGNVALEESIFFASTARPIPTSQIVINLALSQSNQVNWKFQQTIGTRGK